MKLCGLAGAPTLSYCQHLLYLNVGDTTDIRTRRKASQKTSERRTGTTSNTNPSTQLLPNEHSCYCFCLLCIRLGPLDVIHGTCSTFLISEGETINNTRNMIRTVFKEDPTVNRVFASLLKVINWYYRLYFTCYFYEN